MARLHRLEGDKTNPHGVTSADALTAVGPTSSSSVNLPSINAPSPLDDGDKKFIPIPPQRSGKPHSKKNSHLNDSRIHLEPLRPPTTGCTTGRASTRLTVSSSSGRVSWDSKVLEAGSTISENLAVFQDLDRKLQFYKALAVLKIRETAQSEGSLQKALNLLLVATASALDATAVVLYSLSSSEKPLLTVVACSTPGAIGFQTPLETFSLRGLVDQFNYSEEGIAKATGPAATYIARLQNLESYDATCDVDSVLGFSTASVLAGVLPDELGKPRFVLEARSSQEGLEFSKDFMHATLTAIDNIVYPFQLREELAGQTQAQSVIRRVLDQAVEPPQPSLEIQQTNTEGEQLKADGAIAEDSAKAETEWLQSPDVGNMTEQIMTLAPSISGVCLVELHADKQRCEVLAAYGPGFEANHQETLCEIVGAKSVLFQQLLGSTRSNERIDLNTEAVLRSALHTDTDEGRSLTFVPVPTSCGTLPCGIFCLLLGTPNFVPTSMLEAANELPLELQLQPILATLSLALAARQRTDDLRASTRQKRQLLALCRSHFLIESVRDPSSLVTLICELGSAMFHTDHVTLYVSDTIKQELWSLSSLGSVNGLRIPYGRGIAGHVAATKEPLTVSCPYEDLRFDRSFDAKFGFKTESLLTQPVLDRAGETVGVLQAVNFRRFPTASSQISSYDNDVMAVYMRLVAHALHTNSSLIIFAKVQADYWANRAVQESARVGDDTDDSSTPGASNAEFAGDANHEVASVHSLLDSSGFDEAKCIPRNKWSTFAYACWALGRFRTLQRMARARLQQAALMRHENSEHNEIDEDDDSDENQEESVKLMYRARVRGRTSSVVRAGRTHSLITRWHRMTMSMGQDGHGQADELLRDSFDPLSKSIPELENHAFQLFEGLVLIGTFRINERTLRTFIGELASKYRDVPYHSFYHGFDVALSSYALMRSPEVITVIKELEALSLLIAALGHDADHPGNDNQFEVDSNSSLALCYNDISVLENHHAATTFAVLRMEGCDILRGLSVNARVTARTNIVRCILGTDMKHHTRLLSDLTVVGNVSEFENVPDGRQLMLNMIIHGSDLASVGRPLRVALKWVERVCAEFTQQADRSTELGINVPPHLLNLQDEGSRCRLQMNFIDYLVAPLWVTITRLVPSATNTLDNLRSNRLYFSEQAAMLANQPHS